MRLALATAIALSLTAASVQESQAATCTAPRIMFILDKSSSMVDTTVGGSTLWELARSALDEVTQEYESSAEQGLMLFPSGPGCSQPFVDVQPALGSHGAIMGALGEAPPAPFTDGAYATPMYQSLDRAAAEASLQPGDTARVAVLITDGQQWCSASDPDTDERFKPIDSVARLTAKGVVTYVVGFGSAYDAYVLNQMASTAGTARADCDPDAQTPGADSCFYKAENSQELIDVLRSIADDVVEEEQCDGLDNDCDGLIDEAVQRDCSTACGTGIETCERGEWTACTAELPAAEDDTSDDVGQGPLCSTDDIPEEPRADEGDGLVYAAGCGCRAASSSDRAGWLALALLVALALRRRRGAGACGQADR